VARIVAARLILFGGLLLASLFALVALIAVSAAIRDPHLWIGPVGIAVLAAGVAILVLVVPRGAQSRDLAVRQRAYRGAMLARYVVPTGFDLLLVAFALSGRLSPFLAGGLIALSLLLNALVGSVGEQQRRRQEFVIRPHADWRPREKEETGHQRSREKSGRP
jgi:hypothetical protein